jgi:hypothetical protein
MMAHRVFESTEADMGKIAGYLLLGVGVGLGLAYWQGHGDAGALHVFDQPYGDETPLARRLSELDSALALERYEREALAAELAELRSLLDGSPGAAGVEPREPVGSAATLGGAARAERESAENRVRQRTPEGFPASEAEREQYRRQRQLENFIAAGLAPERAQYVMQRQEALQYEALEARYAAVQSGASASEVANLSVDSLLRAELGDVDYEKYLAGSGRPTTVRVNDVLQHSPAQAVGILPGDEIVAYDGERVFDIGELTALTNATKPGQTVALTIERDGQPMQMFVESGPIGISGGGRSTRRGR